ncbi:ABC transporter permease [Streptomyces sp. R302]|uniref:ABC transporter permease n=1 Tax=unclassified Streptomyces TaxID=2593676 RepID=UPI00145F9166|nr:MULTISPECIES: ABC transporter permease [unclassified Streptomyces]NML50943.1 ABC transporter permease [Streptomyces sp. R301]NML81037.1 ABC transporter permease [Streptomyces sp. R302]
MNATAPVLGLTAPEVPARFRHLLRSEWIKLWSLRSTPYVLGAGGLVVTGICANAARSNADRLDRGPGPGAGVRTGVGGDAAPDVVRFAFDALGTAFVDPAWQLLMVLAACLGAAALSGEYATGLARTTFAAVPDRRSVVAAKAVVVTAVLLVFGACVALTSFAATQALLRDHGGLSLSDAGAARAVAASALLAPVCGLVGVAAGALVRHAAGAAVTVIGVLVLLPALFQGDTYRWVRETGHLLPLDAWSTLVRDPALPVTEKYPATVTEAWIVLGAWAVAGLAVAVAAVRHRDV